MVCLHNISKQIIEYAKQIIESWSMDMLSQNMSKINPKRIKKETVKGRYKDKNQLH